MSFACRLAKERQSFVMEHGAPVESSRENLVIFA
jgi:hypothetical protein